MLNTKKIAAIAITCLIVIGLVLFNGFKKENDLPHILLPTMKVGVVYKITVSDSDSPSPRDGARQQFYHVLLKANQAYRFETSVAWLGMDATLYGNGKQLKQMDCEYNARCDFSVQPDKDTWALLKVSGDADALNTPFTLEIRQTEELYDHGIPSVRTEDIHPDTLPVINTETLYNGLFSPEDMPFYDTGEGAIQDYLVELKAGQKVYITATSSELNMHMQIRDFKHEVVDSRDDGKYTCFTTTIPHDGKYMLRIFTYDLPNPKTPDAGKFTLKVSNSLDKGKECSRGLK